jgi:hypothetical protein
MGMAYDQARGLVVLFGGLPGSGSVLDDTWTWDGTTWTKASPGTSPSARDWPGMVYDQPRGKIVLFGGYDSSAHPLADTWTWDGTAWIQQSPASSPPARFRMGMGYDSVRANVVLFGGWYDSVGSSFGDTWTWDGAAWTQQFPTTSPHARGSMGLAFDQVRGQLLLFGGAASGQYFADTWHWDGTNWSQQSGRRSPGLRDAMGMASDEARGKVLLFGGWDSLYLGDTWTWDARGWSIPILGVLQLAPNSGPPGRSFRIGGTGFGAFESVNLLFFDSVAGQIPLGRFGCDGKGTFEALAIVPSEATIGPQQVRAVGAASGLRAVQTFTVTEGGAAYPSSEAGSQR